MDCNLTEVWKQNSQIFPIVLTLADKAPLNVITKNCVDPPWTRIFEIRQNPHKIVSIKIVSNPQEICKDQVA